MSAACMVLHQTPLPLPLYHPIQYEEPTQSYNFGYDVDDVHSRDFKSQQDNRRGGIILGQYSLLQPDAITRTVDYRADDHLGFNALVNNERRQNNLLTDRQVENDKDVSDRSTNAGTPSSQPWLISRQHASQTPCLMVLALLAVANADFSSFSYGVADPNSGDYKSQIENRAGDNVQGQYSLLESDGTRRTVDYAAGAEGFNAIVRKDPALIPAAPLALPAASWAAYPRFAYPYPYYGLL
ncbi:unnamed protein product, partial [Iphiclides podalirius]